MYIKEVSKKLNKNYMKSILYLVMFSLAFLSACTPINQDTENSDIQPANNSSVKVINQESINDKLDLSSKKLEKIPEYVFENKSLKELDVSSNNISGAIQSQIQGLKSLKTLNASNNKMTGIPAEVGQLENLEILDLSNNQLTGLPYELGNLKNLKTLNISGNNYSEADLEVILENLSENVNIIK